MIPPSAPALIETLNLAVPMWIDRLQQLDGETRTNKALRWAADAADAVAFRGDALQFGGKKGEAADVFNHLARGLAALAHAPGGVLFQGRHWCVEHPAGVDCGFRPDLSCEASGFDVADAAPDPIRRRVETISVGGGLL